MGAAIQETLAPIVDALSDAAVTSICISVEREQGGDDDFPGGPWHAHHSPTPSPQPEMVG